MAHGVEVKTHGTGAARDKVVNDRQRRGDPLHAIEPAILHDLAIRPVWKRMKATPNTRRVRGDGHAVVIDPPVAVDTIVRVFAAATSSPRVCGTATPASSSIASL